LISLINLGHDVTIIDDLSSGRRDYINEKAHFFPLDICSLEIENVFKNGNFDFVII
jgi:UDP-glucose 4-epimerase